MFIVYLFRLKNNFILFRIYRLVRTLMTLIHRILTDFKTNFLSPDLIPRFGTGRDKLWSSLPDAGGCNICVISVPLIIYVHRLFIPTQK